MREDYTDITFILDRSGSMECVRQETIKGFNKFLSDQRERVGKTCVSLVQFDDQYEVVYSGAPIDKAHALTWETYLPRGATALLDAMGKTISRTGERFRAMSPAQRPAKVIFVIMTDGMENHSVQYSKQRVAQMVSHQRDKYNWEFLFLGANMDAIAVAQSYGIAGTHSMAYHHSPIGATYAFNAASAAVARAASAAPGDMTAAAFTVAERKAQEDLGVDPGLVSGYAKWDTDVQSKVRGASAS